MQFNPLVVFLALMLIPKGVSEFSIQAEQRLRLHQAAKAGWTMTSDQSTNIVSLSATTNRPYQLFTSQWIPPKGPFPYGISPKSLLIEPAFAGHQRIDWARVEQIELSAFFTNRLVHITRGTNEIVLTSTSPSSNAPPKKVTITWKK